MRETRFQIYTLGCKVNQFDSGELSRQLHSAGFLESKKSADIIIVNTCCVTQTAIRKCRNAVNKNKAKGAKIIVSGCWPRVYYHDVKKLGVDLIWKSRDYKALAGKICRLSGIKPPKARADNTCPANSRSRYILKIQDGCDQYCSYCIIPYTRGGIKSRNGKDIINEFSQALENGFQEIVLTGIHLGKYGRDKSAKINLPNLLKKLIAIDKKFRIRLSSIEINEVSAELLELIKNSRGKICRHLHLPLQSGSSRILKAMNRPYSAEYFKNKILKARSLMPGIALTGDIITGFPGETDRDFQKTYEFVKQAKFSRLHVFPFSAHEKTPAVKMPGQIDKKTAVLRSAKLRRLGKRMEEDYKKRFQGKELEVLVERKTGDYCIGKTEFYFDVKFSRKQIKDRANGKTSLIKKLVEILPENSYRHGELNPDFKDENLAS